MYFSKKKLPVYMAPELVACPVGTVEAYALMLAPTYIFLPNNEKFLSVKAPLDFFLPEELERYEKYENFFLPPSIHQVLPFIQAARAVKTLITWEPQHKNPLLKGDQTFRLTAAPFEISDSVLRTIGPLWAKGTIIEPFFVSAFVNELCDVLPINELTRVRDEDVDKFEKCILVSSWAVFLALHLGYCDLVFLNHLREKIFKQEVNGGKFKGTHPEIDELVKLVFETVKSNEVRVLRGKFFERRKDRISQKLVSRLKRVESQLIDPELEAPTIFLPEGFRDV